MGKEGARPIMITLAESFKKVHVSFVSIFVLCGCLKLGKDIESLQDAVTLRRDKRVG